MIDTSNIGSIRHLADSGDAAAQWLYAMYLNTGVRRDTKQIIYYLKESANKGYNRALYSLAFFLLFGDGVERDVSTAKELCQQAKRLKYIPASHLLNLISDYDRLKVNIAKPSREYRVLMSCWKGKDFKTLHSFLDDDVIFVDLLSSPIIGKDKVESYIMTKFRKTEILGIRQYLSFIPTERYGTVIEAYVDGCSRQILMCRTNHNGLIDRITLQPLTWGLNRYGIYFNSTSKPFSWSEINHGRGDYDNGFHKGHMFCMNCGELSENLSWFNFTLSSNHFGIPLYGRISICPHCKQQVEFIFEHC